jgi:hypothetical protein
MSAPVAFSSLITSVQRRTNIENQTGFITLPEVREYLNEGLAEFYDLLVEARGQEHFRKAFQFSTVSNQGDYALPQDFYELISVDIQIAPMQYLTATPYMEFERNVFRLYPAWAGWFMSMPVYYRILGTDASMNVAAVKEKRINFIPSPQAAYPITLNYIYRFPKFATDGMQDANLVDGIDGWEAYPIWFATWACKHKLKEDGSFAAARLQDLRNRIQALAPQNDAGMAERIRDVETDYDASAWWK